MLMSFRSKIPYEPLKITVNSSPYAVEIYKKLGFTVVGDEVNENGKTIVIGDLNDYERGADYFCKCPLCKGGFHFKI
jgi:hypothetical protein